MTRVSFRIHMLYDLPIGGYHHYCAQLCNALVDRADIDKVALTAVFAERHRQGVDPNEQELVDPRVEMVVIGPGGGTKLSRYRLFLHNLVRHLAGVNNDGRTIVHLHTATGLNLLDLGLLLAYRAKGVPIVRTVHELTAAERIAHPTGLQLWLGRLLLRFASAVIVHDESTRDRVREILGGSKRTVAIIPHGHYLVFRQYIQEATNGPNHKLREKPVVLLLGIKRHKGIEVFLDAMRQLQDEDYPVKGVIAGRINPGDQDLIDRIKSLRNVELDAGYLPNREVWRVYDQSDVVVMPYLKMTTSGAVHLAYAFKRPVIVSDIECFRQIVTDGETGVVVRRGDAEGLAGAIKRLCEDKAMREAMGAAGFERVSSGDYRWERIAELTVGVYNSALGRGD